MVKINYCIKMPLPEKAYSNVISFLGSKAVGTESDWGENELNYKGTVYYLDKFHTQAVRVSPKRFFGLINRKIELTHNLEKEILNDLKDITKKVIK